MRVRASVLIVAVSVCIGSASDVRANDKSRELTAAAFTAAYNLDHHDATALLDKALQADPNDPDAHRAAAVIAWLRIGFLRGSITVDDYLGSVTKPNINMLPPPSDEAQRFHRHSARALQLAEAALLASPQDPEAHFRIGSIVGVQASYGATVEGKIIASFRSASRAYDEHEKVLELDPRRKDAGLVVGTYRYVVSALSLPMRLMAYVAGFGGDKAVGLRMIEQAAAYPGATQTDAKFALLLLYNREKNFDGAMRVVMDLQKQYPRNRQLWYEGGTTLLRATRYQQAEAMLDEGIRRRDADKRERMFGEDALWHYKRGVARARQGRDTAARDDFQIPLAREAREWVRGRAHAELGRLAVKTGNRELARREYRLAIELAVRGNDPLGQAEAESLLAQVR
ncbi:MAG TPA: tetratricopeptide repeat protein [Vicinamibacterales bacterium]|nr:tetratricopeptide repeat protein [Vicinamibacterales bacterium]